MRKWIVTGAVVAAALVVGGAWLLARGDGPPTEALPAPSFVDVTATSGVDHVYDGDWTYYVGGGVSAFDCNDDQLPDLFIAGGENPAGIFENQSSAGGSLAFGRVAAPEVEVTGVTGGYPVDIDADGILDLVILRRGENLVMKGAGDCRFGRANELWGFDGGDVWTTAFSATFEEGAARPTLAFGNYLELDDRDNPTGNCTDNRLVRPAEDRQYDVVSELAPGLCSLSVLFHDWGRTGQVDLRITNDKHYYRDGEEQLWRVEAATEPRLYARDEGWRKLQIWGMGIASQDVTGDGLPEVYLTSQGDNKLQSLADGPSQPNYVDIAIRRGATAHRPYAGDDPMPSTAWHPEFQDVNNDGFVDLYVAKGNVDSMPEYAAKDPNNLLIGQPDGTFVEGGGDAGIVTFDRTRGAVVVDLNLDGLPDLVEVNREVPVRVWQNVGSGTLAEPAPMGNWIEVSLRDGGANRDAIGAVIEVRRDTWATSREVVIGGGHGGDHLGWQHFGIGPASSVEVRIVWPDGEESPWFAVSAGDRVAVGRSVEDRTIVELTEEG